MVNDKTSVPLTSLLQRGIQSIKKVSSHDRSAILSQTEELSK